MTHRPASGDKLRFQQADLHGQSLAYAEAGRKVKWECLGEKGGDALPYCNDLGWISITMNITTCALDSKREKRSISGVSDEVNHIF
jgi:hypothetical protein